MSVRQFNGSWSKKEDRIELRFNTSEKEEFSFWLTRFLTQQLVKLAESMVGDGLKKRYQNDRTADVVQEFQKEKLKANADFKSDYEGGDTYPLGAEPILLVGLSFTPKDRAIAVEFQLANQKRVNFPLSEDMLISLVLLLETLADKAGWGLRDADTVKISAADSLQPVSTPSTKTLH